MTDCCNSDFLCCPLFQYMNEGLAYCRMEDDGDFTYLMVNPRFEEQTGLKDVTGKRVTEVIPDIKKTDAKLLHLYADVAETRNPKKFEYYVKGLSQWFSISAFCPQRGFFVAVFDVITERKQRQKLLLEVLSTLKQVVEG